MPLLKHFHDKTHKHSYDSQFLENMFQIFKTCLRKYSQNSITENVILHKPVMLDEVLKYLVIC